MLKMKETVWKKWIYGLIIAVMAFAAVILLLASIFTGDTIRKGIRIEQTDVSWLTVNEAKKQVAEKLESSYPGKSIKLAYGEQQWDLPLDDIGYGFAIDETVGRAFSVGRNGGMLNKVLRSMQLLLNKQQFRVEADFDRSELRKVLERLKKEIDSDGKDAEIAYTDENIKFTKETVGKSLDIDRSIDLVDNQLKKRDFRPVKLQVDERKPHIVYSEIGEINSVVSYFSTRFNSSDINRSDNIRLACSRINGTVLLPGEEFSANEALGPRTTEDGYKEAPVIINNELTEGTGGGVCQVSSTLYNTVLLAGLDVTERVHHSMILSYISPGRDATINEDTPDLKFINDSEYPVCLQAEVTGNKVGIRILGKKRDDGKVIRLKTQTLEVVEPENEEIILDGSLSFGEKVIEKKAVKGIRVALYKQIYNNGDLISEEKLTEDYYKPVRGKVRVSSDLFAAHLSADTTEDLAAETGADTVGNTGADTTPDSAENTAPDSAADAAVVPID
jgi:vancomycin resistance protein YoaR